MIKKAANNNYQYLLKLYNLVSEYLSNSREIKDNLAEVIVSFCVVSEKIFKIKLHKINPVLVFDSSKFKDDDQMAAIVLKKDSDIETIKVREAINRFKIYMPNSLAKPRPLGRG